MVSATKISLEASQKIKKIVDSALEGTEIDINKLYIMFSEDYGYGKLYVDRRLKLYIDDNEDLFVEGGFLKRREEKEKKRKGGRENEDFSERGSDGEVSHGDNEEDQPLTEEGAEKIFKSKPFD